MTERAIIRRVSADLDALRRRAAEIAQNWLRPNSRNAYGYALREFIVWCDQNHLAALRADPDTVILYLTHREQSKLRLSTLRIDRAAITAAHLSVGEPSPFEDPQVQVFWSGLRASLLDDDKRAPEPARAVSIDEVRRMLAVCGLGRRGARDRALLLVGFWGALRRSEVVRLRVTDVANAPRGIELTLRHTKGNRSDHPEVVPLAAMPDADICPVQALDGWIESSGIRIGEIFLRIADDGRVSGCGLRPAAVNDIVQALAKRAGLPLERFSSHSMRHGFATTAAHAGVSVDKIQKHLRHRSPQMALRYVERAGLWDGHPAYSMPLA